MSLFDTIKRTVGIKKKYTPQEIKKDGSVIGTILLSEDERRTLSREERFERFRQWQREQG
jgi:hypothetical protein